MIIDDSNKEQVFDGLMNRIYNLEQMKVIKAQFDKNPELLKEYQFHKLVLKASDTIEKQQLKEQLMEKGVVFEQPTLVVSLWKRYPVAIAASFLLLLGTTLMLLNNNSPSDVAEQIEIQYQEIAKSSLGLAGGGDTTTRKATVLVFPNDKEKGYAFRNDTLVLYGKFDTKTIRYQYNLETQERKLLIGKEIKNLDYVEEKKNF